MSDFTDTDCIDHRGDVWPEHDYDESECRRCGAEAADYNQTPA